MSKTFVFALSLLISVAAVAQESTSSLSSPEMSMQNSQQTPVAVETSTTNINGLKPSLHLTLGSENIMYENDVRSFSHEAPVLSANWVGAKYDVNKVWAANFEQHFQVASNRDNLGGRAKDLQTQAFEMAEFMVSAVASPATPLLGSSSITADIRYYAPTDHLSQENHEAGLLRSDTYVNWVLNPRWTLTAYVSARIKLNTSDNVNTEKGADADYYQLKLAPIATYNFDDHISVYYANYTNMKSAEAQRGTWAPDLGNYTDHELGLNLVYGPWIVNPALTSETSLGDSSGALLASSSRAFSYETLGYNLNLYASF